MRTLIPFILVFASFTSADCYYPDGKTKEPKHVPCNATIPDSACCDPADACSLSGVCLGRAGFNYRGSCTDQTWKSDNCPGQCRTDPSSNNKPYDRMTPMYPCNRPGGISNDYCCESGRDSCCSNTFTYGDTGIAFMVGMDKIQKQLSKTNSSATTTATITKTASATNSASPSSGVGASIGAAVGVPMAALVLGLVGFLFWRERKRRQLEDAAAFVEDSRERKARDAADRAAKEKLKKQEKALFDEDEPITPLEPSAEDTGPLPFQSPPGKASPRRGPPPSHRVRSKILPNVPVREPKGVNKKFSAGGGSMAPKTAPVNRQVGASNYIPYNPEKYRPNPEHDDIGEFY